MVTVRVTVLAVPIADRGTASSRLRLHDLVTLLPDRFDTIVLDSDAWHRGIEGDVSRFDLLYVQKDARPSALELCARAVDARVPVVYDIDDDFGCWPGMDEAAMCALASVVTVDSAQRAAALQEVTRSRVEVLPCMIDMAEDEHRPRLDARISAPVGTVGSFGNLLSLRSTMPFLQEVPNELDAYVVGPADRGDELAGVRLVPFRLDTFVRDLTAADVFVLAHGAREAPLKDNNRLVMAMSLGTPTLVSPSPAYLAVLADLDLSFLACAPRDVPARLAYLADPAVRRRVVSAGWDYAWTHYRPERCVERFVRILDQMLDAT